MDPCKVIIDFLNGKLLRSGSNYGSKCVCCDQNNRDSMFYLQCYGKYRNRQKQFYIHYDCYLNLFTDGRELIGALETNFVNKFLMDAKLCEFDKEKELYNIILKHDIIDEEGKKCTLCFRKGKCLRYVGNSTCSQTYLCYECNTRILSVNSNIKSAHKA